MILPQSRFEVLDAWRGLSASFVALFHLQAYSHFYELSLLRHSYLFVDFFFVLSGFVITVNYRTRLLSGFSFWHFMLLRFGRLYPLHFATLVAFIMLEVARYRFNGFVGGELENKFSGPHSIEAIITNLFLVQGLGMHDMLTWNQPSWSISAEFYTYAIFAIVLLLLRSRIYLFVAFVILAAPIALFVFVGNIDAQYDFGIVRSLLGFFVGFVCYDLHLAIMQRKNPRNHMTATIGAAEILCVGLAIFFVCFCGDGAPSLAAPGVFGLAVLTFSFEGGFVSKVLKARPFVFLGLLSYSIYMVHVLVQLGMRYALQLAEKKSGIVLFNDGFIGAEMWQGDIAYGVSLALVVGVSYLTYNLIEKPGRRQSRKVADIIFATTEPSTTSRLDRFASESSCQDRNKSKQIATPAAPL
jgi:peptidoglycan/LPS O-acetylase OafA/YrhL